MLFHLQQLKQRIAKLTEIRVNQKEKIDDLLKRQQILLQSGTSEHTKVQEMVGYIEQQRDLYKNSVEKLLGKLGSSNQSNLSKTLISKNAANISRNTNNSGLNALKEIQKNSRKLVDSFDNSPERSYHPSPYRNTSSSEIENLKSELASLKREKFNAEHANDHLNELENLKSELASLKRERMNYENRNFSSSEIENLKRELEALRRDKMTNEEMLETSEQKLREQISGLKEQNMKFRLEIASLKEKNMKLGDDIALQALQNAASEDVTDSRDAKALSRLGERLATQERLISDLESQLTEKQSHLQTLSDDKDRLVDQLDTKTRQLDESRRRLEQVCIYANKNFANRKRKPRESRLL
jgi:uncharacterized coiled-coil protein SlyX